MPKNSLENWNCDQIATLMFCIRDNQLLLIHKKRGLGAGKVNAPGGKIEPQETLKDCACRETLEETGVIVHEAKAAGTLCFSFNDGFKMRVHPFVSYQHSGTIKETDEAIPFWQDMNDIPYQKMWADDQFWLPQVLAGARVQGQFSFDEDRLLDYNLEFSQASEED